MAGENREAFGQRGIGIALDFHDQKKVAGVRVRHPHDEVRGHGDDLVFEGNGLEGPGIGPVSESRAPDEQRGLGILGSDCPAAAIDFLPGLREGSREVVRSVQ